MGLSSRNVLVESRHQKFKHTLALNGGNATEAAIAAGYSARTAKSIGSQLLTRLNLREAAGEAERAALENFAIDRGRILQELQRVALFDPRTLYRGGRLLKPHEWDSATAAAVASIDYDEITAGRGRSAKAVGRTTKVRAYDKVAAIDKALRVLGAYEADNRQRAESLAIQVNLVNHVPKKE